MSGHHSKPLPNMAGVVPQRHRNKRMVQNALLIWVDSNMDEKSKDCQNTIAHLRQVMNTISTFTNAQECIEFLQEIKDDKVCMIISGSFGKHIVPRVHDMFQVDSIFIFCHNKQYHEQWARDWSKIKGVYTDIKLIRDALKQSAKDCEQNSIGFTIVPTFNGASNVNLDRLDPMFMYTQILKEILLDIKFEQKHLLDFTNYCREILGKDSKDRLDQVDTFKRDYRKQTPIWWYTWESFLYPMLNRALRLSDIDVIIKMGFFVADLHRHIDELHNEQFIRHNSNKIFMVYRGQGMSKDEFKKVSETKGGLFAFHNFLSTSMTGNVSMGFAKRALKNPDMVGVLFAMKINPRRSTTSFASVTDMSCFQQENEILFAMQTVFRIRDIKQIQDSTKRLFRVELELTSDNDQDLQILMKCIREETSRNAQGWSRLGSLLLKLNKPKQAEEVYRILLQQTTDETKIGWLYRELGNCKQDQANYEEAIRLYKKSIEIDKKCSSNPSDLASSYNNIGSVYNSMGEYAKALSYYEKALGIRQQSLPTNHPDLAGSYNNIGNVYGKMREYAKALSHYEKGLAIWQQSLPPNHPHLASSYNNIGLVYENMGEYTEALSSHQKALSIWQQSLPTNHPDLASSYNNIGNVYGRMGEYVKALSYFEKALAIKQQSLPTNHPDLASSYNNIGNVYNSMGEYAKALSYYEKALGIRQQSLPTNHPDLASSYNNIGNVYDSMGEYVKALSYFEKALAIKQQSLPTNHPDMASSYNNIGNVYGRMGEYAKALSYFEKALGIRQQSLPPNHPDLAMSYGNIGGLYIKIGEYSKAFPLCKRAVEIAEQSLSPNHPHLKFYKDNLDKVKNKL